MLINYLQKSDIWILVFFETTNAMFYEFKRNTTYDKLSNTKNEMYKSV
jgi:hypothetical protein